MAVLGNMLALDGARVGVGLALRTDDARYLFAVAGSRYQCPRDNVFYAGVGGGVEDGESWPQCALREAREEIGAAVELVESPVTWNVCETAQPSTIDVPGVPRPLAIYAMPVTPALSARRIIVIYEARLAGPIGRLAPDEVSALIALSERQVALSASRVVTVGQLIEERAQLVATIAPLDSGSRLYPIGTARALAILGAAGVRRQP